MARLSATDLLGRTLRVVGRTTPQQRHLAHGGVSAMGRIGRRWWTAYRMFKAGRDCCHGISWQAVLVLLYRALPVFSDIFFSMAYQEEFKASSSSL